jgi:hypothetical protein
MDVDYAMITKQFEKELNDLVMRVLEAWLAKKNQMCLVVQY